MVSMIKLRQERFIDHFATRAVMKMALSFIKAILGSDGDVLLSVNASHTDPKSEF